MNTLHFLLIASSLLMASIVLTPLSARVGLPVLLLFFGVGMLAGEDGPGGIRFADFPMAYLVSHLALAVILLDGGMRTRTESFRVGLRPASVLATFGVLVTAGITGLAAIWLLNLPPLVGLLMGAIVASTDAAAVFNLLQGRGLHLNQRVSATLEIESGSNDPMAIFLVVVLLALIQGHIDSVWSGLGLLLQQFGIGIAGGLLGGWLLMHLLRRLDLPAGLYPLLAMSGGLLVFALTGLADGSGFVAIYLVGLWLGNSRLLMLTNILQVHDGLAWLAQLALFLILGLLVSPSQMLDYALPAVAIALVLTLLARPLAVVLSLWPFGLPRRELGFISWVGLRGAVPIVLALFPVMAGLPEARLLFDVTCVIVLVSLLLQGMSLTPMARWLKLEVPPARLPQAVPLPLPGQGQQVLYVIERAELRAPPETLGALRLPEEAQLLALARAGVMLRPDPDTPMQAGDCLLVAGGQHLAADIGRLLNTALPEALLPRQFFGDFVLPGDASLGDLAMVYGISLAGESGSLSLSALFARRHHGHPVVGDSLHLGPVQLVVMQVDGDQVLKVGMKLPVAETKTKKGVA